MSLPKGFKRLKYIESSGTQYVDSGFAPKSTSRVVMDVECTESVNSYKAFFGVRNEAMPTATESFNVAVTNATTMRSDFYGTAQTATISTAMARTVIDKNANVTTGYGVTITNTSVSAKESSDTLVLLSLKTEGSGVTNGISAKLYSCQIYDNGTLVRDFIPCQNAGGAIGLWDAVNSVFYGNAGTGTFTAGPVVPEIVDESEITELEYIQSSGTQYVDTEFKPNQDTHVVMDVSLTSVLSNTAVFGSRVSSSSSNFIVWRMTGGSWRSDYGTDKVTQLAAYIYGDKIHVDKRKAITTIGDLVIANASADFACESDLFLGTDGASGVCLVGNIYGCQIYDNGLLERDYVPAMLANGEVGLYDRVYHEFYRNAGTGEFIAGPEMAHEGYTELEYIESSGAQFVETDVSIKSTSGFEVDFASVDVSSEKGLIGGFTYGGYNNNFGQYNGQWAAQYGNNQSIFFGTVDTERHTISQNVVQRSSYFDGELLQSELPFYDNTQRTFRLFCYNGGSSYPTFWIGSFKLYYCKIYDNGTEVRTYIPVLHPTGVAGLWDSVNERFYASATTTDLIAGPEVATVPKAPANFRVVSETDTLVTLAWDASEDAVGYRLYRQGQLLEDTEETSVAVTVEPFAGAMFTLTAYNENGEGAGTSLTYYSIPENPLLHLITDRTAQDVAERNPKGYYAASDLNRVGYAIDYLAPIIRGYGYTLEVHTKTDWTDEDWKLTGEMVKYLQSLNNLKAVFSTLVELPETMDKINYVDANNIEQLLLTIDETIVRVVAGFTRANAFALRSGAKGLPVSQSDRGRNWGELDAMKTTWANWQLATWYLLLYGNLKAEGVVE